MSHNPMGLHVLPYKGKLSLCLVKHHGGVTANVPLLGTPARSLVAISAPVSLLKRKVVIWSFENIH
jgi:hypothetical protein